MTSLVPCRSYKINIILYNTVLYNLFGKLVILEGHDEDFFVSALFNSIRYSSVVS
jgi:hypothetical protein